MGRPNLFHASGAARGVEDIQLPALDFIRRAPLPTAAGGVRMFRLFRLSWPGEVDQSVLGTYDMISRDVAARYWADLPAEPRYVSLQELMQAHTRYQGLLPRDLAYHLAVNRSLYFDDGQTTEGVWALSDSVVNRVLNVDLLIDDQRVTVLEHLRWLVGGMCRTPWYTLGRWHGGQSRTRGMLILQESVYAAVRAFFRYAADCLYDENTNTWSTDGRWWWRAASALLLTRYAPGNQVYGQSGLDELYGEMSDGAREAALAAIPEMKARLAAWRDGRLWENDDLDGVDVVEEDT